MISETKPIVNNICLVDNQSMKRIAVLYSCYTPTIDAIKFKLADCNIVCLNDCKDFSDLTNFDLVVSINYKNKIDIEHLAVHHSLLPAFDCENPIEQSILSGVKVTGITFYYEKSRKIIAQYPLFIKNETHYDELEKEFSLLEQSLYPIVIEKIINNEQIDANSLLGKKSCCGGCSGCTH